MRRLAAPSLALALGLAAAFALVSCGGEDAKLLPGATAAEISENLDTVKLLANEGDCIGAADASLEVSAQVESLEGVDPKLKRALERGAARLDEVVTTCEETTETIAPSRETTEETTKTAPGQEKKKEREREREESEEEKTVPTTPTETTPAEPPTTTTPSESGGTGAPGGVSPAAPAPEAE